MKYQFACAVICALLISGCAGAPTEYYNYKSGEANLQAALAKCEFAAQTAINNSNLPAGSIPHMIARKRAYDSAFSACMSELGWLPK